MHKEFKFGIAGALVGVIGIGIAVLFFILPYRVKDMSDSVINAGFALASLLIVGGILTMIAAFTPVGTKLVNWMRGFKFRSPITRREVVSMLSSQEVAHKRTSDWLLEVLAFNQQHIYEAVQGSILRWNFSGLKVTEDPFFEVHFRLFNTSIFDLDFKGVDGDIKVGGIPCRTPLTANSPQRKIIQGQDFYVIVTQGVLSGMASKILEAGNNKEKLKFDLSQLTLNIETVTKGYEGLKPNIKFDSSLTPDITTWLALQESHKIGYWT